MQKRVLVIDDEPAFVNWVEQVLSHEGYEVFTASDGREALRLLFARKPDLILLDVVMPHMNGRQVCNRIREMSDIPIIILSGMHKSENDIVRGLDCGADDYLVKPVGEKELVARVRATLRRAELPPILGTYKTITYSDDYLTVNITDQLITVNGKRVKLTPIEFRLLSLLVENANRILTHRELLKRVWGWEYIDDIDYLRIYILHLRQKLEPFPSLPRYILTEPGFGYYFQTINKCEPIAR